ncbi:MAG: hypothetical protein J6V14_06735, partial [Clostridia bacterium]|nr:hypothetical protein [Clostridia bacterium]
MIEFEVNEKESGRSLETVFFARFPGVPAGVFFRALRKRDLKVNGVRTGDARLKLTGGDRVTAYVDADRGAAANAAGADNTLPAASGTASDAQNGRFPAISVVYESEYILVAEKPQGLLSEPDPERPGEPSLLDYFKHGDR